MSLGIGGIESRIAPSDSVHTEHCPDITAVFTKQNLSWI
jgi:hypothetical protein